MSVPRSPLLLIHIKRFSHSSIDPLSHIHTGVSTKPCLTQCVCWLLCWGVLPQEAEVWLRVRLVTVTQAGRPQLLPLIARPQS